ncbi:hypothetical protein Taro_033292 [Colocasia esculenta]|uniref:Sodium/metabolite cotransporter BASS3, chloroplastic n=1 Tax=Colocasia esculenta TaxID=4460 RepID=A0A843VXG8_COLES|nr:hypothetical protein [Colocasia esculenta]
MELGMKAAPASALHSSWNSHSSSFTSPAPDAAVLRPPLGALRLTSFPHPAAPAVPTPPAVGGPNSAAIVAQVRRRKKGEWACSTFPSFPHVGRVGWQRREGRASLLSFGGWEDGGAGKVDVSSSSTSSSSSSGSLSAMLPYVVAATAVAALAQPATFSWCVHESSVPSDAASRSFLLLSYNIGGCAGLVRVKLGGSETMVSHSGILHSSSSVARKPLVSKEYYAPALGGIMLSIGIRLSLDDFALAFRRPLPLSVGFMAQYVLKPLLGLLIARAFGAPSMFYAGFILTCCVAGAQLSSYASYLSKGDVALSILLTSTTTIASAVITPLLTGLLIGSVVPVDPVAMSKSILQVVLIPVTLGLVLNTYAKPLVDVIKPVMPFVAMVCTSLCIGSPLAINRGQILSAEGLRLLFPILSFHAAAFTLGYWLSKLPCLIRQDEGACRTISLCTGMQSSTLAGLLATQFLGGAHAVPAACSVVVMAIMGLCLASFWGSGSRIRDIFGTLFPAPKARSPASS